MFVVISRIAHEVTCSSKVSIMSIEYMYNLQVCLGLPTDIPEPEYAVKSVIVFTL
jgi:hypothetical protein